MFDDLCDENKCTVDTIKILSIISITVKLYLIN